jgi:uncharacterized membrane protein
MPWSSLTSTTPTLILGGLTTPTILGFTILFTFSFSFFNFVFYYYFVSLLYYFGFKEIRGITRSLTKK